MNQGKKRLRIKLLKFGLLAMGSCFVAGISIYHYLGTSIAGVMAMTITLAVYLLVFCLGCIHATEGVPPWIDHVVFFNSLADLLWTIIKFNLLSSLSLYFAMLLFVPMILFFCALVFRSSGVFLLFLSALGLLITVIYATRLKKAVKNEGEIQEYLNSYIKYKNNK